MTKRATTKKPVRKVTSAEEQRDIALLQLQRRQIARAKAIKRAARTLVLAVARSREELRLLAATIIEHDGRYEIVNKRLGAVNE